MTFTDLEDVRLEHLARLPILEPNPRRAAHTRLRCRAALAREQRRRQQLVARVEMARRVLEPVIVAGVCLFHIIYVGALVVTAFRLHNLLHWP